MTAPAPARARALSAPAVLARARRPNRPNRPNGANRQSPGPAALFERLPKLAAFLRCAIDIRNVDVAAASKAGVISLTQTTALDVAGANIYVNAIACGGVLTPPFEAYLTSASEAQKNSLYQQVPSGRLGRPEEYANVAVFLASQDHYLVGQVISPNGGYVI